MSDLGDVPCDLSHHAFDVTCMLSPHQLRPTNSTAAYIVLVQGMMGYHPPVNRITDTCKNITFPQLRLRAVKTTKLLLLLISNYFLSRLSCFKFSTVVSSSTNYQDCKPNSYALSLMPDIHRSLCSSCLTRKPRTFHVTVLMILNAE